MKKIFESDRAIDMVITLASIVLFATMVFAYAASANAETWTKEFVEFSDSVNTAKKNMQLAEEEMFWQAMDLHDQLCIAGGEKYITKRTESILEHTDGHLPNLEYYKAAIEDMTNGLDPDGDRFDDCDYKMSWEQASKAEAEYARLSEKLELMKIK